MHIYDLRAQCHEFNETTLSCISESNPRFKGLEKKLWQAGWTDLLPVPRHRDRQKPLTVNDALDIIERFMEIKADFSKLGTEELATVRNYPKNLPISVEVTQANLAQLPASIQLAYGKSISLHKNLKLLRCALHDVGKKNSPEEEEIDLLYKGLRILRGVNAQVEEVLDLEAGKTQNFEMNTVLSDLIMLITRSYQDTIDDYLNKKLPTRQQRF